MKVAIYARVSTSDKGQDVENQMIQLRELCQRQDWTLVGEYTDQRTGRTADREQFQQMFRDAYQRKFDLVLFWALDRFSREGAADTLRHLQKLTSFGVKWRSHTEPYIDSAGMFADVIVTLLATVARQESVRRSERASAAYNRLKTQGKTEHLGRKRLVVDRVKIQSLRNDGLSVRQIAQKLGIGHASVHRILQSMDGQVTN